MIDMSGTPLDECITPFQITPGASIVLSEDFDPSYRAGIHNKADGVNLLQKEIDTQFPTVSTSDKQALLNVRDSLIAEAPEGAAPDPFLAQAGPSPVGLVDLANKKPKRA